MNRTTAGLCLAALVVSCSMNSVLRADELVMQDDFFVADESRHQWVNELNGRTGQLLVRGALLSSPCSLGTNEVELPLPEQKEGPVTHYVLKLDLSGCGEGGAVTSAKSGAGHDGRLVIRSTLLAGKQRVVSTGRAVVYGSENQFTYWLKKAPQQGEDGQLVRDHIRGDSHIKPRSDNSLLRLRLDYE